MDQTQIDQLETEESMFVQTARGITSDGTTLTLRDVTPSTLFFSDRPQRVVGHMTTAEFVELWGEGDNSFEADPPNAVLSFLEPGDDAPTDAVIVIKNPSLTRRSALVLRRSPRRNRSEREPGRSPCSSTRSGGRCRPSRCAACAAANADGTVDSPDACFIRSFRRFLFFNHIPDIHVRLTRGERTWQSLMVCSSMSVRIPTRCRHVTTTRS